MYNFFRLLPVAALLSLGAATATPVATPPAQVQQCPTYEDGLVDGQDHKANLAATYGAGTPEYEQALNTAITNARYNARNAECPTYWRGYVQGLSN